MPRAVLLIIAVLSLVLAGCHQPDSDLGWINRQMYERPAPLNPSLVLDSPRLSYSSEQFGRQDWPASPEANKFVTYYEYSVYRNINRDRQAVSPYGRPLNHSRNDATSYSWGQYRR